MKSLDRHRNYTQAFLTNSVLKMNSFDNCEPTIGDIDGPEPDSFVLLPASELKRIQILDPPTCIDKEKTRNPEEKEKFIQRFRDASDKYYQRIMKEVIKAIELAKGTTNTYRILDFKVMSEPEDVYQASTMMYGYWDDKERKFNTSMFTMNGIEMPFDRAKRELAKSGYKLTNSSDLKKSRKIFLKLSW